MIRDGLILLICMLLLFVPLLGQAESYLQEAVLTIPDSFSLQINGTLNEWMPLDEVRTAQLTRLLDHIEIELVKSSDVSRMTIQVDHNPSVCLYIEENKTGQRVHISSLPAFAFSGEGQVLSKLIPDQPSSADLPGIGMIHEMQMMEECGRLFELLMRSDSVSKIEKKDRQNVVGYGPTSKRIMISITPAFTDTISSLIPDAQIVDLLSEVGFTGNQNLYLLVSDQGEIYKASYSGSVETASGTWKISSSWKMKQTDDLLKRAVEFEAVKRPENEETSRKITWSFEMIRESGKEEFSCQRIERDGNQQEVQQMTSSIEKDGARMHGTCVIRRGDQLKGKNGVLLELNPDLILSQESPFLSGDIGFRYTTDQQNPYSGSVSILAKSSQAIVFPEVQETISLDMISNTEIDRWSDQVAKRCAGALLSDLVLIDSSDTAFLSDGLSESDWLRIVLAAGPVVEEE